eukprot:TRINITY_DN1400_c3_g1_i1.p1 TRINITY_DN1400_c3_g1~~TRINITY_DN1400_c3_g1_i1.p1  ORF type:complete len:262 (-),score=51.41 TRINITY_DN1400_c3_g1_i1:230-1015(-)
MIPVQPMHRAVCLGPAMRRLLPVTAVGSLGEASIGTSTSSRSAAAAARTTSQAAVRFASSEAAGSAKPLVATRTSNVGKLAGAVAQRIRNGGQPLQISAVGPDANYMALKAMIIANTYIQENRPGKNFAVVPIKQDPGAVKVPGDFATPTVGILLDLCEVPEVEVPNNPQLNSAHNSNTGLLAGLMAGILNKEDTVTVAAMGAQACSNVLKATMICQGYLAESLGSNGRLALVPRINKFEEHGEERSRVFLTCLRTTSSPE